MASVAFTDLLAWTGESDRGNWTVLKLHSEANAVAANDGAWEAFR